MAVQAGFSGDIRSFVKRMENISSGMFNNLIFKIKNNHNLSDKEKSQKLDLMGFFDGIKMYCGRSGIKGFRGQNWQKISKFFAKDKQFFIKTTVGQFSTIQMQEVIRAVIESEQPIAFAFDNRFHQISLIKWDSSHALFVNHDSLRFIKANDDGAKTILEAMHYEVLFVHQISLQDSLKAPEVFRNSF